MRLAPTLASGHVPVQYMTLSGGFDGTDQTVAIMSKLTMGQWGARSPKIRGLAINILNAAGVAGKDYEGELVAIHNWVRDNIRYTRDVQGQETLCPPEEIAFNSKAGDCDDMAMLDAALLASIGFSTRFKVIGVTPNSYSHVYLQAQIPGAAADVGGGQDAGWISLDPIMKNWQAGQEAPAAMIAISKVYPENTTEDLNMSRQMNGLRGLGHGVSMNGMGYIADQRCVSHLSPDPTEENVPGSSSTDDHGSGQGPGNYVVMDSMLDTDLPIEAITNTAPAFPQNAHYDQMAQPVAQQKKARLYYQNGAPAEQWVYDRMQQDADNNAGSESDASNPIQGLYGLMGPDALGQMAGGMGKGGSQQLVTNPNVQALVQSPEGIDKMFSRQAQVMNGKAGDRILYQGIQSLSERPPIRPVNSVAGLGGVFGVQSRRAPMMGGLGVLAGRSMSGPGIGDLCDLADDTNAAAAPAASPALVPLAAVPPSTIFGYPTTTVIGFAAVAGLVWYLMRGGKKSGGGSSGGSSKRRSVSNSALKDDFLMAH